MKKKKLMAQVPLTLLLFFATVCNGETALAAAGVEGIEEKISWQEQLSAYPLPDIKEAATNGTGNQEELSAEALSEWWTLFHDDTLTELINQALRQNKTIEAAEARVRESREALGIKKSALLPWLDGTGSVKRDQVSENSPYVGQRGYHTDYRLGIDATWEIDVFGRQRENVRAASLDLRARHGELYAAWVRLSAEVAMNYVTLRALQERLAVAEEQVEAQENAVELLGYRRSSGLADELPLTQAKYTLEQTKAILPELRASIGETMNRLTVLTGDVPGTWDERLSVTAPVPQIPGGMYAKIPVETLRQRPDLYAAEQRYRAQIARTKAAKRELLPKISLFGSLGWESGGTGSFFSLGSRGFSLGPSISIPIFHAGAIRRNIKAQSEKESELLADYENCVLNATAEVRDSLTAIHEERERKDSLQRGKEAAGDALELARNRYQSGLTDYQSVIDARRSLLKLQDDYIMSCGQEAVDLVGLFKALGGGWRPMEEKELRAAESEKTGRK